MTAPDLSPEQQLVAAICNLAGYDGEQIAREDRVMAYWAGSHLVPVVKHVAELFADVAGKFEEVS